MTSVYAVSFFGFWLIMATLTVQWLVASSVKAKQPGAVPGKFNEGLSHDSFVFRAHRTFMNTLENLPLLMGTFFLAIFTGANPWLTSACIWVYALARIAYTLMYYLIKTEKNPSPRTYVFMVGVLANLVLLGAVAWALVTQ